MLYNKKCQEGQATQAHLHVPIWYNYPHTMAWGATTVYKEYEDHKILISFLVTGAVSARNEAVCRRNGANLDKQIQVKVRVSLEVCRMNIQDFDF